MKKGLLLFSSLLLFHCFAFGQVTLSAICAVIPNAGSFVYADNFSPAAIGCDKLIFASSEEYTGDLGGLDGANAKCQLLASLAGFPGRYKAWVDGQIFQMSEANIPYIHVNNHDFMGGYTLPQIQDNWTDLTSGTLLMPIVETELITSAAVGNPHTWTGADYDGSSTGGSLNCQGWTSSSGSDGGTIGDVRATDSTWTNFGSRSCSNTERIFCFQQ